MAGVQIGDALRQIHRLFSQGTAAGLSDASLLRQFTTTRDEEAFAALVARHGPMVLAVCRSVLRDPRDAEDAFQATFLVLVRQAGSLWVDESLGGWLHRVAQRVAVRARADTMRRHVRERREAAMDAFASPDNSSDGPSPEALHEEIARLPDSYRQAIVLCYLEGRTQVEAARELRCGEATIRRRLVAARERLRLRLERRGVAPAIALPAVLPPMDPLPSGWANAVVKAAVGNSSPAATALADVIARTIVHGRAIRVGSVVMGFSLIAGLGFGVARLKQGRPPVADHIPPLAVAARPLAGKRPVQEPPAPIAHSENEVIALGRVLGPDGNRQSGATILVRPSGVMPPRNRGTSNAEGAFRFVTERSNRGSPDDMRPTLVATASGFGFSLPVAVPTDDTGEPLTLQLVEDLPIEGRVTDQQGRPIAGARVRVRQLYWPQKGDLAPWLEAARRAGDVAEMISRVNAPFLHSLESTYLLGDVPAVHAPIVPPVVSGSDGRFRLEGIGRDRVAELIIEGPGIASTLALAITRPIESFTVPAVLPAVKNRSANSFDDLPIFGARLNHIAVPGRTIEGVVRDRASGAPVAGLNVSGGWRSLLEHPRFDRFRAVTDAEGRFKAEGLPADGRTDLTVYAPNDQPYFGLRRAVVIGRGSEPLPLEIYVRRGVWVTGQVVDEGTGRPVQRGRISYFVFLDNPAFVEDRKTNAVPEFDESVEIDADGKFRVAVYPGRGIVTASNSDYLPGIGTNAIPSLVPNAAGEFPVYPIGQFTPTNVHGAVEVSPAAGAAPSTCRLTVRKGANREVRIVGPDGAPLSGTEAAGVNNAIENPMRPIAADHFTVTNLAPGETRLVVARHAERKLAGMVRVAADGAEPLTLQLHPAASVVGRVVDDQGQPRVKGLEIQLDEGPLPLHTVGGRNYFHPQFTIESNGRFRVEGLIAGEPYGLNLLEGGFVILGSLVPKKLTFAPGELKDLGDVKLQPTKPREGPSDFPPIRH